ncbi:MAG: AbrB/MazE/SpoVT family DNA-binding domain-containing protein [Candidatus Izemoplasmatales bacterium]
MIIELRKKAQITIPKEIVVGLGLAEGDTLDVRLVDGAIVIEPVTVYRRAHAIALERDLPVRSGMPDKYAEGPSDPGEDETMIDATHDIRK